MLKNMNISSELFLKDVVPYLAECANKLNKFAPHKNLFANSFAVMRLQLLRYSDAMLKYFCNNLHYNCILFFFWGGGLLLF